MTFPTWKKLSVLTARLKHKDIVDKVCIGQNELSFGVADGNQRWETADDKDKIKMIGCKLRNVKRREWQEQ